MEVQSRQTYTHKKKGEKLKWLKFIVLKWQTIQCIDCELLVLLPLNI